MRFDVIDLYLMRYPYGDDMLYNIVSVVGLPDATGFTDRLLENISCCEIKTEQIEEPERTVEYFSMYRPDVMMVNIDVVNTEYMKAVTEQLSQHFWDMPLLICASMNPYFQKEDYMDKYNGYYYAIQSDPMVKSAENIKQFLMTKLVSMDFLRGKVRECCRQTITAMKCNPNLRGFDLLVECVDIILQNPYVRADYYGEVIKKTALQRNMDPGRVEDLLKETVKAALSKMSPYERSISFPKLISKGKEPTYVDFIYAAAEITSKPCKKILRLIEDEPLFAKDKEKIFV